MAAEWHPIMAARETEPGTWYMVAQYERCYGIIRLLTHDGQFTYRVVTWAPESADRELIGYFGSLREACSAAHRRFLSQGVPERPPMG